MTNVENSTNELARQLLLNVSKLNIAKEIEKRLQDRAKTMVLKGFRRGKVPIDKVKKMYGRQIEKDVIASQVNEEFYRLVKEKQISVAGSPDLSLKNDLNDELEFQANFEVFPEIKFTDLSNIELTRFTTSITDEEIDRTLDILVKQRATYINVLESLEKEHQMIDSLSTDQDRSSASVQSKTIESTGSSNGYCAELNDRVTINFLGTIEGKAFQGGNANDFTFILGEKHLLPEFTDSILGMRVEDTKEFSLTFPENYQTSDIAGKIAQFSVSLTKLEKPIFPKIDSAFAISLGIEDGDCNKMRDEIRQNLILESERRTRLSLKNQVMDELYKAGCFSVPKALVLQDQYHLQKLAKKNASASKKGVVDTSYFDDIGMFYDSAERRVKLGLLLNYLIDKNELKANPSQVRSVIEKLAKSYKNPEEIVNWYYSNPSKLLEIESLATEDNVVDFVCQHVKIIEKIVSFEELAKVGFRS